MVPRPFFCGSNCHGMPIAEWLVLPKTDEPIVMQAKKPHIQGDLGAV